MLTRNFALNNLQESVVWPMMSHEEQEEALQYMLDLVKGAFPHKVKKEVSKED